MSTMDTVFRIAGKDEADTVYSLYRSVMGRPFCIWNEVYPGMTEIEHDLENDDLYVLEQDGVIIGAVSAVPENELDNIGCWSEHRNAGEFARVVIRPELQGKHLSHILVSGIIDILKSRGIENIHISVATKNMPAQKTYLHFGFTKAGEEEMWGHSFYLYELKI